MLIWPMIMKYFELHIIANLYKVIVSNMLLTICAWSNLLS